MCFGLATVIMRPTKLDKRMQSLYYHCLPFLGVNRHITKPWRMLPKKYHGLGLPTFVVVCFVAMMFLLQRHWGFNSAAGNMLQQAYEAFLIEVGLYGDVFTRDFKDWGILATDGTWFKNFWEFASYLTSR